MSVEPLSRIAVVKLRNGNFGSVIRMLELAGAVGFLAEEPRELTKSHAVIIAGVGAFDSGMEDLENNGWVPVLNDLRTTGQIPIMGICLGMQLLFESSEEGSRPGLNWLPGKVTKLKPNRELKIRVPNMGWREIEIVRENPLLPVNSKHEFYFVHSFAVQEEEEIENTIMVSKHNPKFIAGVQKDRVFGVQFHPKKSHAHGRELLANFVKSI